MKYKDFHELIVVGYDAHMSPREIFDSMIRNGLDPARIPSPATIRHIGINLIGAQCRWHKHPMRAWRSGSHHDLFPVNRNKKDKS